MEVDAASVGEGSRTGWREKNGGLSKAERRKRQTEGRCGRQGHLRKDHPVKGTDVIGGREYSRMHKRLSQT